MAARTAGRSGRPWRRARDQTLAESDTCWLCGHGGAATVDHEPPRSVLIAMGLDPNNRDYLRPAHGAPDNPCPTCGLNCNQKRGTQATSLPMPHSRDW